MGNNEDGKGNSVDVRKRGKKIEASIKPGKSWRQKINPFSKKVNKTDRSAAPRQCYGWSKAKAPRF